MAFARTFLAAAGAAALLAIPIAPRAQPAAPPPFIAAALADPGRPTADTARDAARKPSELLVFAGLRPGDTVADLVPGTGYFTRIFAKAVGARGHVYAIMPAELIAKAPVMADPIKAIAADPGYANVTALVQPVAAIAPPAKLDVAWTSNNYHDMYGFFGADQAAAFDKAVFAALKPGGVFIVIDHVAPAGAGGSDATTLHRIDPETVKAQVLAAGFRLEAQSPLLQNPADSHQLKVFDPTIRGHTDQFVFKFRKPA